MKFILDLLNSIINSNLTEDEALDKLESAIEISATIQAKEE